GTINIYANAPGCDSPPEIADECGFTLPCLPFGNYYLESQADVDDFFNDYPDCFDLHGSLKISGENITDLSGLDGLNSIENDLRIYRNNSLINFIGLNSLTSIGGRFKVGYYEGNGNTMLQNFVGLDGLTTIGGSFEVMYNDSLSNFYGLNSLQSIGEYFAILSNYNLSSLSGLDNLDSINGGLSISGTNFLTDITQLSNLTFVDGSISIINNNILNSLLGLDNIEPGSIDFLNIYNNSELSTCAVASICEYLADSNTYININNNAPGCNNQEEVEFACTLNVPENNIQKDVKFYPNPATKEIFISTKIANTITELSIYNCLGQRVLYKKGETDKLNISMFNHGIYIIELVTNESKYRQKLIIK
ncbi:MAG: T9SS type A sorting domain-containing protein, partial [Bacteroidota bacterium]